jgi:hypothetical protein
VTRNESWVVLIVVAALAWAGTYTIRGRPSAVADAAQQAYSARNRIVAKRGQKLVVRAVNFQSNGHLARVEWYDGDLEPVTAGGLGSLVLEIDGKPVSAAVKGNGRGNYEDGPAYFSWQGRVAPGQHSAAIVLTDTVDGAVWGAPYADRGRAVVDGLLVTQPTR